LIFLDEKWTKRIIQPKFGTPNIWAQDPPPLIIGMI